MSARLLEIQREGHMPAEGISQIDLDALRGDVDTTIQRAVDRLREIEVTAQQRLRAATTERQLLSSFLDELRYRLRAIDTSPEPPMTVTGPLTEVQISAMHGQEDTLRERQSSVERIVVEMDQLTTRLSWLIHQIEGARSWVMSTGESEVEGEPGASPHGSPGEQVVWAQIIMGQEAERARLAREIHDGPAQALANTVMRLQFVEQVYKHRPEEVQAELDRLRGALQDSLKDVRRFMFNLRPASLADIGLLPTLRHFTSDYSEQFGIPVELSAPETLALSANQELAIFRIVQEALQNVQKHAQATKVHVTLQKHPGGSLMISIADNGRGLDPKVLRQRRPTSSGLVSMRERAATVGGTLKIDGKPGAGTTITAVMPVPKD